MLIWIDCETTGLNPATDRLLEVAVIVTDDALAEVARFHRVFGNARVIDFRACALPVQDMHTKSGMWCASLLSANDDASVDEALSEFLHGVKADGAPTAGSTVGFDRGFVQRYLPKTYARIGYRSVDVSSLTELAKRFWPDVFKAKPEMKDPPHRAIADIENSIALLRFYLSVVGALPVSGGSST